ncbi:steroid 21-hydroxylase isoform X2 [Hemicordylus capensis]|uniref:steroid 21-hydroxylase isoform X2 n=1 Tax=Hemicordylus capensis TaxID=884348 RepID=UPI0023023E0C|nr:steroid 21-hydroxylase isoform X2 [Hemicordylus capensis]
MCHSPHEECSWTYNARRTSVMPSSAMLITVVLVLLAVALVIWRHVGLGRGKFGGDLPGPRALPLIGNLPHLFHPDLPIHFLELAQQYGPIYRLRFGSKDVVVLNSSDLIREALTRKWSDFAGRPYSFVANLISLGGKDLSLGDYTPAWRLQRKLVHVSFQRCLRGDMEQIVSNQARCLSKIFRDYGGEPVDVARDFSLQACQVISALVFGPLDVSAIEEMHDCIIKLVDMWSAVSIQILDFLPMLRIFPNTTLRHLLSCVNSRDAFVQGQIKKHKESHCSSEIRDMMDHMLQFLREHGDCKWEEAGLSPEHLHMAIVDLFIGGTETTAALLTWAVAFLLHHPQIQERIHEELMTVVGLSRDPTYNDRKHLPYLSATITETLRLRPSAPLALPHMTNRDTSLSGFLIPKGTTVIPNLYGAHHDESKWNHPMEFRPGKFMVLKAMEISSKMSEVVYIASPEGKEWNWGSRFKP